MLIKILIVAIWKSRQAFRAYGRENMPLQGDSDKLPVSHNNVVGDNIVLQLNILEIGVLTRVGQIYLQRDEVEVELEMSSEPRMSELISNSTSSRDEF